MTSAVRLALALTWLALLPESARAQSFYAFSAVLAPAGEPVGVLYESPIEIQSWSALDRPLVRYRDRALEITSIVALAHPDTRVVVGVGGRATIEGEGGWTGWLAPRSWVPLVGRDDRGLVVVMPEEAELPFARATIVSRAPALSGVPESAFELHGPIGRARGLCDASEELEVSAAPSAEAARWRVPGSAGLRRVRRRAGWTELEVTISSSVVRAFVQDLPRLCAGAGGGASIAVLYASAGPCYDSWSELGARILPPGTVLRADGGAPFARTRGALIARVLPGGEVVLREDGADRWRIRARIDVPIDDLAPAMGTWTGPGRCWRIPPDWPSD